MIRTALTAEGDIVFPGGVTSEADGTEADEDEGEDDEEAEGVLQRHDEHQTELDQVQAGVETGLDPAHCSSPALLHILLQDLNSDWSISYEC